MLVRTKEKPLFYFKSNLIFKSCQWAAKCIQKFQIKFTSVGIELGCFEKVEEDVVGVDAIGFADGVLEGHLVGEAVNGFEEGVLEGYLLGMSLGVLLGKTLGKIVGKNVGSVKVGGVLGI